MMIAVIAAGVWGLLVGVPFHTVTPEQQTALGAVRALYGLLVFMRVLRTLPGAPLLHGWRETERVRRVYTGWSIVAALMAVGLFTPIVLVIHWWLGATIQRKNRVYSVEDVLFRATGFCLLFVQSHLAFSVDSLLGWTYGLGGPSLLGTNFFMWAVALLMFSAGLEKLWSPLWHKGLGFYFFMSLPHLVRPCFRGLNRSKPLSVVLSWITVWAEVLLIPAMWFPIARWPLYAMLGGFAATLFILVDISFIGQITLSLILGCAALDWFAAPAGGPPAYTHFATADWVLFSVLAGLFTLSTVSSSGLVKLRSGIIASIMAWTVHFRPFSVFVEIHFYGLYLFRLIARFRDGTTKKVLDVFTDEGSPGKMQTWRPRTFQGSMYRFTDYCIAVLENLEERRIERAAFVEDIAYAGFLQLPASEQQNLESIEIQVRVFDPALDFEPETTHWLSPEWQGIGTIDGFPGSLRLVPGALPPRYKITYRWPVKFV